MVELYSKRRRTRRTRKEVSSLTIACFMRTYYSMALGFAMRGPWLTFGRCVVISVGSARWDGMNEWATAWYYVVTWYLAIAFS